MYLYSVHVHVVCTATFYGHMKSQITNAKQILQEAFTGKINVQLSM